MATLEQRRRALALRAQGLTKNAAAAAVGIHPTTIKMWEEPAYAEAKRKKYLRWSRRNRDKRRAYNKAWRDRAYPKCPSCGGRMAPESKVCVKCLRAPAHDMYQDLEFMWAEGKTIEEIAVHYSVVPSTISSRITRARTAGYKLPYRHVRQDRIFPKCLPSSFSGQDS